MNRNGKIAIGIGLVVLLGGAAGMSIRAGRNHVTEVKIQSVGRKDLTAVVTASGWIRPHRKVDVQSDVMGRIVELRVQEGDRVTKGQVLLRIDPTQLEAGVARAKAGVSQALAQAAQAKAATIQAQRAYERAQQIATQNANLMSQQQIEDAQTTARTQAEMSRAADYNVEVARAALHEAEDQLSKTVIRAPMDGVVTRLNVDEGETAIVGMMNNPGSLLLTVSDLSDMEAVIKVDETDVPQIQLGDTATVSIDAFPKQTFSGRVTEISHSAIISPENTSSTGATQQAVDFEVVVKLDDPPKTLRPDLSATADVVTATRKDALAIPIIALTVRERGNVKALPTETAESKAAAETAVADRSKDEEGVFVVKQGKAQFVPVTVGIAGREDFEVLNGLKAGDSVVAGPYEAIRGLENGKAVRSAPAAKGNAAKGEGAT
jgi:HlyD family secretion protein